MLFTLILMVVVGAVIVFLFVAPILGFVNRDKAALRFTPVFLIAGISLSVVRIACYSTLIYVDRTGQRDITTLPLALLLIPEGSLVPESASLTIGRAVLFSGLLAIGSFAWAAILGWSMSRKRRSIRP